MPVRHIIRNLWFCNKALAGDKPTTGGINIVCMYVCVVFGPRWHAGGQQHRIITTAVGLIFEDVFYSRVEPRGSVWYEARWKEPSPGSRFVATQS